MFEDRPTPIFYALSHCWFVASIFHYARICLNYLNLSLVRRKAKFMTVYMLEVQGTFDSPACMPLKLSIYHISLIECLVFPYQ
jgi:hypothetical protein